MTRIIAGRIAPLRLAVALLLSIWPAFVQAEGVSRATINLTGFGENIDEGLINPTEPGKSEAELTEQVAGILHTVKMDGGRTVRWFVTSVWPQYRCARDPENQATSELDPAWFTISRILLEQAQKEGIAVVVVLADTTNGTFAGLPSNAAKRAEVVTRWHQHQSGSSKSAADCEKSFQDGYHGRIAPAQIFEDGEIQALFAARFFKMAEFLKTFPALAALEMFNEPDFAETERPEFGQAIARIRHMLYSKDPSLRAIPIYSGIAAWNGKIAQGLSAAGALADEPYINVHSYAKAGTTAPAITKFVGDLIAYLGRTVPGKPIIIAEAGSEAPIHDLRIHSDLFHAFLSAAEARRVGIWMWGTFADDSAQQPDFKWEFNSTSLSGGAFRDILVAADREESYRNGKAVAFASVPASAVHQERVTISQIAADDPDQRLRLRWQIGVGPDHFISVSRAGILLRAPPSYKGLLSIPGPGIAIAAAGQRRWAEVAQANGNWRIRIYQCQDTGGASSATTPPYVQYYAAQIGNRNFSTCGRSSLVDSGLL